MSGHNKTPNTSGRREQSVQRKTNQRTKGRRTGQEKEDMVIIEKATAAGNAKQKYKRSKSSRDKSFSWVWKITYSESVIENKSFCCNI